MEKTGLDKYQDPEISLNQFRSVQIAKKRISQFIFFLFGITITLISLGAWFVPFIIFAIYGGFEGTLLGGLLANIIFFWPFILLGITIPLIFGCKMFLEWAFELCDDLNHYFWIKYLHSKGYVLKSDSDHKHEERLSEII